MPPAVCPLCGRNDQVVPKPALRPNLSESHYDPARVPEGNVPFTVRWFCRRCGGAWTIEPEDTRRERRPDHAE